MQQNDNVSFETGMYLSYNQFIHFYSTYYQCISLEYSLSLFFFMLVQFISSAKL